MRLNNIYLFFCCVVCSKYYLTQLSLSHSPSHSLAMWTRNKIPRKKLKLQIYLFLFFLSFAFCRLLVFFNLCCNWRQPRWDWNLSIRLQLFHERKKLFKGFSIFAALFIFQVYLDLVAAFVFISMIFLSLSLFAECINFLFILATMWRFERSKKNFSICSHFPPHATQSRKNYISHKI